jgi:plastocyanin
MNRIETNRHEMLAFKSLGWAALLGWALAAEVAHGAAVGVTIFNYTFQPSSLTIKAGDTVTWTQHDSVQHSSTSNTGVWDSGLLTTSQTFSHTFSTAGNFPYHCSAHSYMTGSVLVKSTNQPPTLSGETMNANGRFQFVINGAVGETYLVQASTNSMAWQTIQTVPATNQVTSFKDTAAPQAHRFYRVQLSP